MGTLTPILEHQLLAACEEGRITDTTVVQQGDRSWILSVRIVNLDGSALRSYTVQTQRGDIRVWADPRKLFRFMSDRLGVVTTTVSLKP